MNSDRRLVDSVTELSLTPAPASDRRRRDGSRTRIGSALLSRRAQTLAMAAAVVPLAGLAGMNALRAEEPDVRATELAGTPGEADQAIGNVVGGRVAIGLGRRIVVGGRGRGICRD